MFLYAILAVWAGSAVVSTVLERRGDDAAAHRAGDWGLGLSFVVLLVGVCVGIARA